MNEPSPVADYNDTCDVLADLRDDFIESPSYLRVSPSTGASLTFEYRTRRLVLEV